MSQWNPSDLFKARPDLRISDGEKLAIHQNLPQAEDGNYYVDAVFEGGGVKGTAFLGALRCFADAGIQFRKVAGTSAGAITAAMVAAGFSIEELEQDIIGPLDYQGELLSKKTSWLMMNGSPSDDLGHFGWLIGRLLMAQKDGQYSSEPFKQWLAEHLQNRLPNFTPFSEKRQESLKWHEKRDLKVVVSDISRKEMQVLPDGLAFYGYKDKEQAEFSVAEAVRLSMSIPLFFEPGQLKGSTIVDGGILSNFPLWIYDAAPTQAPRCPTFGFRLVDEARKPEPVKGAMGILQAMFETMQVARDSHHVRENDQGRIINIKTEGVSATKFDLTNEDKTQLYQAGYEAAKAFLKQWNWTEHLQKRGFCDVAVQKPEKTLQLAT